MDPMIELSWLIEALQKNGKESPKLLKVVLKHQK
jgi:hypothetical protein